MDNPNFSEQIQEAFAQVTVPTLISVLGKYGMRTRFLENLRPISGAHDRFIGEAFTLRTIPVREDLRDSINAGKIRNPHREAISNARRGHVIVFDTGGTTNVSLIGDIIAKYLVLEGIVGVVTDGGIGDAPGIDAVGLPVFSAGYAPVPGSNRIQVTDWNLPIGCAGVAIYPGDVMVGDANGVVCVPRGIALEVAAKALAQEQLEAFLIAELDRGEPLEGTYPPNPATLQRYADSQASKK
jgi:regulator of RNase E activity RraA